MKLVVAIVVIVFVVGSFVADYKWRQWMAARKQDHDR
jgi:hypothetical protein